MSGFYVVVAKSLGIILQIVDYLCRNIGRISLYEISIIARGLTQKELAQQMGVSYTVFNEILNGKRPVTTEYALLLEAALGTNANIWLGLQADYNMQKIKQDKSFMKRLESIRKYAAIF